VVKNIALIATGLYPDLSLPQRPLVRQVKSGQSCRMKGVYHVNYSFARVADGAANLGNLFVEAS
jgi:hypothetical protein